MSEIWVVEKDQTMIEGEALTFSVDFIGASVVTSPTSKIYKNGADYSGTVQSSVDSANGSVVTLKTITAQANDGGSVYVVVVQANVDGNVEKRKFLIRVVAPGAV
ncbi:hypothetical protein KQH61_03920 [bacterium]|nr:hypothetical protein [bacterium]MCB2179050.1 hypothetical protein [bacterium]